MKAGSLLSPFQQAPGALTPTTVIDKGKLSSTWAASRSRSGARQRQRGVSWCSEAPHRERLSGEAKAASLLALSDRDAVPLRKGFDAFVAYSPPAGAKFAIRCELWYLVEPETLCDLVSDRLCRAHPLGSI